MKLKRLPRKKFFGEHILWINAIKKCFSLFYNFYSFLLFISFSYCMFGVCAFCNPLEELVHHTVCLFNNSLLFLFLSYFVFIKGKKRTDSSGFIDMFWVPFDAFIQRSTKDSLQDAVCSVSSSWIPWTINQMMCTPGLYLICKMWPRSQQDVGCSSGSSSPCY